MAEKYVGPRGEEFLEAGGNKYVMLRKFGTIRRLQEYLGQDLRLWISEFEKRAELTVDEMLKLCHEVVEHRAGEDGKPDFEEFADDVVEEGIVLVFNQVVTFLSKLLAGRKMGQKIQDAADKAVEGITREPGEAEGNERAQET